MELALYIKQNLPLLSKDREKDTKNRIAAKGLLSIYQRNLICQKYFCTKDEHFKNSPHNEIEKLQHWSWSKLWITTRFFETITNLVSVKYQMSMLQENNDIGLLQYHCKGIKWQDFLLGKCIVSRGLPRESTEIPICVLLYYLATTQV